MTVSQAWQRIQAFDLPGRAKRELFALFKSARRLGEAILRFMVRHSHFTHCVLLGAVICFLLCMIPIAIAQYVGLMALIGAGAIGLAQDMQDSLKREFGDIKA